MRDLPIHEIDLAPFHGGDDADRASVADAFDRAGRDSGFILLTGHGVDPALIDDAFDAWQSFFDLPLEEKLLAVAPPESDGFVGYTAYGAQALAYTAGGESPPDLMEAFSIGREDTTDAFFDDYRDWFPSNVWPARPASLRAAVDALEHALHDVADVVLRAMALALELPEEWLLERAEHALVTTRCNHYLRGPGHEPLPDQPGLGGHTDYGMVTLLVADPVPGLQVLRGGAWHDVIPPRGSIVCNLGDMLAMWTNDRWVSTMHRVLPPTPAGLVGGHPRRLAGGVNHRRVGPRDPRGVPAPPRGGGDPARFVRLFPRGCPVDPPPRDPVGRARGRRAALPAGPGRRMAHD